MAGRVSTLAAPFWVIVRCEGKASPATTHVQQRFACFGCAIEAAHKNELAWIRLVGAQWHPLSWWVLDTRDYSKTNPFKQVNEGVVHACKQGKNRRRHAPGA